MGFVGTRSFGRRGWYRSGQFDRVRRAGWRGLCPALALVTGVLSVAACGDAGNNSLSSEVCPSSQMGEFPNCVNMPPVPPAEGKSWHLVFAEEFGGDDYDHTKFTPCFDWNVGFCTSSFNEGKETYRPEQVRVSDGTAKLVAEPLVPPMPDAACLDDLCTYKAGLLSTARPRADDNSDYLYTFTYGYVEARMKFPAIPGFFTAFWMMPATPTYDYSSEIDIAEILGGDPSSVYQTYHYDGRKEAYRVNSKNHDNGACPVRDYSQDWVNFGVNWQPDGIAWFINGVKCGEFTDPAHIENRPMQLILNMMIDNSWERDAKSVLEKQDMVGELEVDYIRVFQQR